MWCWSQQLVPIFSSLKQSSCYWRHANPSRTIPLIIHPLCLSSLFRWPRSSISWRPSPAPCRGRVALLPTQWASTVGVSDASTSSSSSCLSPWLSTLHSPSGSWRSWTSQWWVVSIFVFILSFNLKASQLAVAVHFSLLHIFDKFPSLDFKSRFQPPERQAKSNHGNKKDKDLEAGACSP